MSSVNNTESGDKETKDCDSKSQEGPVENKNSAQKMHRKKKPTPKTHAVYWLDKVSKPSGSAMYGVQIAYQGQRHRFPLETADKTIAADRARDRFLSLVTHGWEATIAKFKPRSVKAEKSATIGEWIETVRATAEFRTSTLTTYAQSLRQIAAEIENIGDQPAVDENGIPKRDRKRRPILVSRFDYRSGGREAWLAKVHALPLSLLSDASVQRWKLEYIARAGGSPEARKRAENSAATLIRCARSLFSSKAREYAAKELSLPDPLPFAGVKLPKKGSTAYQSKIDAVKLIAAARQELTGEPFKVFTLGLLCGLRKREIDLLTWQQVDFEKAVIRIERTEYFSPKSEDSIGEIDLDAELVALLRGWRAQEDDVFVINSNREPRNAQSRANYRCEKHFDVLYAWLRTQGVTARKPLHELRKELGALLASTIGIFAAQSVLRHAQISTTAAYYTDKKQRISAGLGALLAPPPSNVVEASFAPEKAPQKPKKQRARASR
jgi:integrase